MMFRETPRGTVAIPQPSHAWISGQIMRAWGNARFGSVEPFEDVCLAAGQHDIGWLTREQAPTLNPATGRPRGFRELGVARHTAIWIQDTAMGHHLGTHERAASPEGVTPIGIRMSYQEAKCSPLPAILGA
jgi:hypothetical protein